MITRVALLCKGPNPKSDGGCFEPESIEELAGDLAEFGDMETPTSLGSWTGESERLLKRAATTLNSFPVILTILRGEVATQALQESVNHIRKRFSQGVSEALGLLDQKGLIDDKKADVGIFGCDFRGPPDDNTKCKSLQGLRKGSS
jgi:hypothetical protein